MNSSSPGQSGVVPLQTRLNALLQALRSNMSYAHPSEPAVFSSQFDECLTNVFRSVASNELYRERILQAKTGQGQMEELLKCIETMPGVNNDAAKLRASYGRVWEQRATLLDERKQEQWANLRDHLRSLIFRTLTTLMIAGIVLGTGWMAKAYEIPLPLLRLGAGS